MILKSHLIGAATENGTGPPPQDGVRFSEGRGSLRFVANVDRPFRSGDLDPADGDPAHELLHSLTQSRHSREQPSSWAEMVELRRWDACSILIWARPFRFGYVGGTQKRG